ncbi:hypothetical protein INS49_001050 [Diaporthe citri]|uniref:uncharacterized protein n=1 Tax=Diaporthe citri TaxID=83186 RepID=UPI001C80A0D7|nr:uncharacterized protein INS49_001050 [Diaporthe citri]KAG6366869.1 hypothetical protein INS49_001050 [Diaporthe citri]
MVRLPTLLGSVQLAVVLSSSVVFGQTDNTVEWTIGTKIRLFGADTSTPCAASLQDAQRNAMQFTPVLASSDATSSGQDGSSGTGNLAATFYITNGLHKLGTPFTDTTSIRVGACNLDKNQTFYVALEGGSPFAIFTSSSDALDRPGTSGDPLTFSPSTNSGFCTYADDSGKLVVQPTKTPLYFAPAQVTNLTASSFGNTPPTSDVAIPQCNFAVSGNGSMLESLGSADCIVARAFATIPSGCDANPSNKTCILHLWSAFCLDLPEARNGLNASDALEVYVDGVGGGGSGSTSSKRQTSNDPLFGNPESNIPLEDQFWMGVMKNIINQAIGAFKILATPNMEELKVTCMGMSHLTSVFEASLGKTIRDGCRTAFKTFDCQSIHELSYDNDIEKAGSVFADVVSLLSVVVDVARAARVVGAVDQVLARFGKATATIGEGKGLMLEAKEGENTVQIFRDGGDGKPKLLYTDSDVAAMEKSIEEGGFENCKVCVEGGGTKLIRRQRGILRKLCCFLSPQTLEAPESVWNDQKGLTTEIGTAEAIPLAERTIAALSSTAGITAEETKLITTMSEGFAKWYAEGQSVSANVDEIGGLLLEAYKNQPDWVKISTATTKLYGLGSQETSALRTWAQHYYIWPDFEPAITKLPAATGLVIRSTDLEASTVTMLNKLEAGTISKGIPGIYEVSDADTSQDLVVNVNSGRTEDGDLIRKVMATTLNLGDGMFTTTKDYLLMINSKTGRYVAPVANSEYRETDFVQGIAGKFKLIGRQELNGGEAAKAAGKPGPYGVYYFEEIDAPASTSTATLADLRKALTDEGVSLPGTSAKRGLDGLNVSPQAHRRSLRPVRNRVHLG